MMETNMTILSLMSFTDAQLDKLRAVSPRIDVVQVTSASFNELPEALQNRVNILYGWGRQLAEAHRFPRLKWIQTHSAGVDSLRDRPVWSSPVIITSLNGVHAVPITEHALAMMLAFRWQLPTMFRLQARSEWPGGRRWDLFAIPDLRGSTLGLIGYGAIARELARQAQALGMRVLALNRSGRRRRFEGFSQPGVGDPEGLIPERIYPSEELPVMLPECDYVVVLAPLTETTRHLLDAAAFEAMKSSGFLVNLARGGLVDEEALADALRREQIAGAALDVFEQEPLPVDSPLWQMEQVIISPHVSGFTPSYDELASALFAENLRRYVAGESLLNLVDRERGY
jgi:phosphoglycerate dehydrogenase-like enzyme